MEPQSYTITIYAEDTSCQDGSSIVATGTVSELENEGIQVEGDVQADHETRFTATQTNPETAQTSGCSNIIGYRQVSTPPAPPEFSATLPESPGGSTTPRLIGSAPAESTVEIYANATCTGTPLASGSASAFEGAGIEVTVPESSITVFHGQSTIAGLSSSCSTSSIEYSEVKPEEPPHEEPPHEEPPHEEPPHEEPPHEPPREEGPNPPGKPAPPKLHVSPEGVANDNTPTVSARAPGAARVEVFEGAGCRGDAVAAGTAAQVAAGLSVGVADNTTTSLYGVSVDGGGDRSACTSDPVTYVEDSNPPHTRFTSGPGPKTRQRTVQFTFVDASADPTTSFRCRLDHRAWKPCSSPLRLRHLGHRRHTLTIRGTDAAGNVEPKGAQRSFKVIRHR